MFGWRKKTEGFEWHQYIRTAVRQRRQQRRDRMVQARQAAGEQVQAAGAALVAGSLAAGVAAKEGAKAGMGAAGLFAGSLSTLTLMLMKMAGLAIAAAARPVMALLARPVIGTPVVFAGGIVLGAVIGRARVLGFDREAWLTLAAAILLFVAGLPMLSRVSGLRMPQFGGVRVTPQVGFAAAAIAAVAGGVAWYANGGRMNVPNLAASLPLIGTTKPLEGRAYAVSGDALHIAGTTVRLAGIEAPEQDQRCGNGNRRWRCGVAATEALSRLVSGRSVTCTVSGKDSVGRPLARCMAGKTDVNAELVRRGHVFAETGLFARYSSLESEARAAKIGVWASGDAERPADYRARQRRSGV
jgi:endonuclease YncB( thermonuclease family)